VATSRRPLLVAFGPAAAKLFDARTGDPIGGTWPAWQPHTALVTELSDGRSLLVSGVEEEVDRRDLRNGAPLPPMPGPDTIWGLAEARLPDGRTLVAAAGNSASIHRLDLATGEPIGPPIDASADWVVALRDAGGRVLLAGDDPVRIWDALTGERVASLPIRHAGELFSIEVPGGASILVVEGTGEELRWLTVPDGEVRRLALPGRPRVVAAHADPSGVPLVYLDFDDDGPVQRWRLDHGEPDGTLPATLVTVLHDGDSWRAVHADHGDLMIDDLPPLSR
jgi:WD40 repeat protein